MFKTSTKYLHKCFSSTRSLKSIASTSLLSLVLSCGGGSDSGSGIEPTNAIFEPGPAELSYCSTTSTYSPSHTITGSATYEARVASITGLGAAGAAKPIRFAEVRITDSTGSVAQCAETDVSGNFSFALPQDGNTYTISISSRGSNSSVNASVLTMPEQNIFYTISTTVVSDSSKSAGTINAPVTGDIEGGAFNIFDQIVETNIYLRAQVGTCSTDVDNCLDFTVAPKVSAYWRKGFNPNEYFGAPQSGLSFYLPSFSRLFILGGISGDTDNTDTDHFDNSVIIHEYGHFIEDVLSNSDSPGGAHNGNAVIDPRLAHSEAWGNFLQAAVLNPPGTTDPRYIDTRGNIDGSTQAFFFINLETAPLSGSGSDRPLNAGEGNFREFAITRFMWDVIDTVNDTDTLSGGFNEIWASMTSGNGYLNSNAEFRSLGFLNLIQTSLTNGGPLTDWSPLQASAQHQMSADTSDYAQFVATGGGCGSQNFNVVPAVVAGDTDVFSTSHLLLNNDFYHYRHTGGTLNLNLNYTTAAGTEADLDLYVYNERARFGVSTDISARSTDEKDGTLGDIETESVSASLPAGDYLINVNVYTQGGAVGSSTDYELLVEGARLCPSTLP